MRRKFLSESLIMGTIVGERCSCCSEQCNFLCLDCRHWFCPRCRYNPSNCGHAYSPEADCGQSLRRRSRKRIAKRAMNGETGSPESQALPGKRQRDDTDIDQHESATDIDEQLAAFDQHLELLQGPYQMQVEVIRFQLFITLHAHTCPVANRTSDSLLPCAVPFCGLMRSILDHFKACTDGKECQVAHCWETECVIAHWIKCDGIDCTYCSHLR